MPKPYPKGSAMMSSRWPTSGPGAVESRSRKGFRDLRELLRNWLKNADIDEATAKALAVPSVPQLRELQSQPVADGRTRCCVERPRIYPQANLPGK